MDLGLLLVSRVCSKEELPMEKKKKERVKTSWYRLPNSVSVSHYISLYLNLITFRVMVTASFCMQVSLLSISNPEPYRIWVL